MKPYKDSRNVTTASKITSLQSQPMLDYLIETHPHLADHFRANPPPVVPLYESGEHEFSGVEEVSRKERR